MLDFFGKTKELAFCKYDMIALSELPQVKGVEKYRVSII